MRLPWPVADALADALAGEAAGAPTRGPLPGGGTPALARLHAHDPTDDARTRNHLDAPVSRLSASLRHGMTSAVEVRDHRVSGSPTTPPGWGSSSNSSPGGTSSRRGSPWTATG